MVPRNPDLDPPVTYLTVTERAAFGVLALTIGAGLACLVLIVRIFLLAPDQICGPSPNIGLEPPYVPRASLPAPPASGGYPGRGLDLSAHLPRLGRTVLRAKRSNSTRTDFFA